MSQSQYSKVPLLDEEADRGSDDFSITDLQPQKKRSRFAGWEFLNTRFLFLQLFLLSLYALLFGTFSEKFAPKYHGANLFYCELAMNRTE